MDCPSNLNEITMKVMSAFGGFLGGSSLLIYIKPKNIKDGIVRVLVSTAAAATLAPPITLKIFDATAASDSEVLMGVAFSIGFIAWNVLGAVANFFANRQGKDIVEMTKDINPLNNGGQ